MSADEIRSAVSSDNAMLAHMNSVMLRRRR